MAPPIGRLIQYCRVKKRKIFQGTHGFEPWTYRTAADCSTTELYPQHTNEAYYLAVDIYNTNVVVALHPFDRMWFTGTLDISASVV